MTNARGIFGILCFAVLPLLIAGCASGGAPSGSSSSMAATSPVVSVERFLQAVNVRDLDAMSRIFGTTNGPVIDQTGSTLGCAFKRMGSWISLSTRCRDRQDVELSMDILASILEHDEFRVRSESNVPGRSRPAIRVGVDLVQGQVEHADVPFVLVQGRDGRWLVEEIAVTRITGED